MPVLTAQLKDIVIQTRIGIHDHERERKQRLFVNCEIGFTPATWPAQSLVDCYDYDALYRHLTVNIANGPHIDLVETLLHDIARFIFADPRVTWITVSLSKPDVLPQAAGAGVMFGPCTRETWDGVK